MNYSWNTNNVEEDGTASHSRTTSRGALRKERNRRWKRQVMAAAAEKDTSSSSSSWRRRIPWWLSGFAILAWFSGVPLVKEFYNGLPSPDDNQRTATLMKTMTSIATDATAVANATISNEIDTTSMYNDTTMKTPTKQQHQLHQDNHNETNTANPSTNTSTFSCPLQPCHLNLVFMGDSLTRFMYISLAYFFSHNNTWMDPTAVPRMVSPDDMLGDQARHIWTPWYEASHAMLAPYEEVCDCYRQPKNWLEYIVENRYYYDPYRNITLTYIQSFGAAVPIRGHWHVQEIVDARRQQQQQIQEQQQLSLQVTLPTGTNILGNNTTTNTTTNLSSLFPVHQQAVPFSWSGNWSHAIRKQVSILKPDTVILNADKWYHEFSSNPTTREDLRLALEETGIPRAIWKTSTSNLGGIIPPAEHENDIIMCDLLSSSYPSSQHQQQQDDDDDDDDDDVVNTTTATTAILNETTTLTTTILTVTHTKKHHEDNCLNVSGWTQQIPNAYYNDNSHYYEPVYRQMNEQLFDFLGLEWGGAERCTEFDSLNLTIPTAPYTSTTTTTTSTNSFSYNRHPIISSLLQQPQMNQTS